VCSSDLEFTQDDIKLNGWAIESRIYSEDPQRGFLPSSGRITEYREPNKSDKIRIDSGIKEGGEVSMFYDPMIAKLCSHGSDRNEAISLMRNALANYIIRGVSHNMSFLEAIIKSDRFINGDLTTNFIQDQYPEGFLGAEITNEITKVFLCVSMYIHMQELKRQSEMAGQIMPSGRQISTRWVVSIDDTMYPVFIRQVENGYSIRFETNRFIIESNWVLGNNLFKGLINSEAISVKIEKCEGGVYLTHAGARSKVRVRTPRVAELNKFMKSYIDGDNDDELTSQISGKIVAIKISPNEEVTAGQELLLVEAMKMENIIYAHKAGKVKNLMVKTGENVIAGQTLMEIE
jgi:propionyl-CoA carboxylase alpha chain